MFLLLNNNPGICHGLILPLEHLIKLLKFITNWAAPTGSPLYSAISISPGLVTRKRYLAENIYSFIERGRKNLLFSKASLLISRNISRSLLNRKILNFLMVISLLKIALFEVLYFFDNVAEMSLLTLV